MYEWRAKALSKDLDDTLRMYRLTWIWACLLLLFESTSSLGVAHVSADSSNLLQSTLVISNSLISNNCLSRSENLVPVLTQGSTNRQQNIVEKRRNCSLGAFSPLFHNIFNISVIWESNSRFILLKVVVRLIVFLSSANLICRSVSESPLDFEITRVDCISGDVLVFPTSIIAKVLFALVRICSFIGTLEYKHLSGGLRGVDRKIVPRITVWHHEACRVMPDCDREGRIFLSTPYNHDRFFFFLAHLSFLNVIF